MKDLTPIKKLKSIFSLLTLLVSLNIVYAHQGGHGAPSHDELRQWHDVSGEVIVEGSLLLTNDKSIIVEKADGSKCEIALESLSWTDLYYAVKRQKQIDKINVVINPRNADTSLNHTLAIMLGVAGLVIAFYVVYLIVKSRTSWSLSWAGGLSLLMIVCAAYVVACSNDNDETNLQSAASDPKEITKAFTPYPNVQTHYDDKYFYVESNGLANHQMMVGITAWIAQVPVPQLYSGDNAWKIPLKTKYASSPVSLATELRKGAVAIAANGIPVFNPLNASGLISKDIGELDAFGGHSGRGDDYHYHIAPLHLQATSGTNPIAYALDGYPMYGSTEPDGSAITTLDSFNGHEWNNSYHYHGTSTYPFVMAKMRGEVSVTGTIPENMIIPQPDEGHALRSNPHPINSDHLVITDLQPRSSGTGYILTYTSNGIEGSVEYYWDEHDLFTFIFHDVNGQTTTETFQR